jgi:SAM-dependent methyltransferase
MKKLFKIFIGDIGTNNFLVRDNWVNNALSKLSPGKRLLDAGAGTQRFRKYCSHLEYVSQDFCQYDGLGDGTSFQSGTWDTSKIDLVSDITAIPAPDNSFDAILCTETIEHVPDAVAALKEFSRLLRPGGELILTAPFCSLTHMAPFHFYSGFNKFFYEHNLSALGFEIVELNPNGDYEECTAQELRRLKETYGKESYLLKACIAFLLYFLKSKHSEGCSGSELLCYGYHVRAIKDREI